MRTFFSRRTFASLTGVVKSELPELYPAIDIHTKDLILYPSKYGALSGDVLRLKTAKKYNIYHDKLSEFLEKQKKDDESHLYVPKEVVLIGRSNVGKSSLINALLRKKVSNVSKTPGTTKTLLFHEVYDGKAFIVDAPGYGFAKINAKTRDKWLKLMRTYLSQSSRIARVYMLVNMEHGMKQTDLDFLEFVNTYNHCVQVVLTKSDKVRENELMDRAVAIGHHLKQFDKVSPVVHICSTKENFGVDMLKHSMTSSIVDFHSKFELDHEKYRLRLEALEAKKEEPAQKLPPPSQMFKLLIKQGHKPQ